MYKLEKEEFTQRMRALSDEEKEIALKTMSNEMLMDELNRRLTIMTDNISMVRDILKVKVVEEWKNL